jgi:hypothetical protein
MKNLAMHRSILEPPQQESSASSWCIRFLGHLKICFGNFKKNLIILVASIGSKSINGRRISPGDSQAIFLKGI